MSRYHRLQSDDSVVDSILHKAIAAHEAAFPGRELSYYLIGSWSEDGGNALSDIDLAIVWPGIGPGENDRTRSHDMLTCLSPAIRLDPVMLAEREVPASLIGVNLKLSSTLVHGPDIRDRLPLPPLDAYTDSVTEGAFYFMSRILRGGESLDRIDYPDPHDRFFGYAHKRVDAWYPPEITAGLKEWVSTATRIARALVAIQCGRYVGSKGGAITAYGACVGDEWAEYLRLVYDKGKREWAYRVPEDDADWNTLRVLCERFLAFERHFLAVSRR